MSSQLVAKMLALFCGKCECEIGRTRKNDHWECVGCGVGWCDECVAEREWKEEDDVDLDDGFHCPKCREEEETMDEVDTPPAATMSPPLKPDYALHLRVEWDTGEEEVELPEVVIFAAEEVNKMITEINELVGGDEEERKAWTNHILVKHLEALTDYLVEDWEVVEGEDDWFDGKYPDASCFRCSEKVDGTNVVYCGGGGGACETWYCTECYKDGTHDCNVCV